MAFFPVIVGLEDASGARLDAPLPDGSRPSFRIRLGDGLTGVGSLDGESGLVIMSTPLVTTTARGACPPSVGNNKVLTTNGSGVAVWINKTDLAPAAEQVIGRVLTTTSTFATVTGYTPHPATDNNPILWSEGGLVLSHAGYTTKSAASRLRVSAGVTLAATAGTIYLASLHIGTGNALAILPRVFGNSFLPENIGPVFYDVASPGASQSYTPKLRVVPIVGNTDFYINGDSSGHTLGGKWLTWVEVVEYIPAP